MEKNGISLLLALLIILLSLIECRKDELINVDIVDPSIINKRLSNNCANPIPNPLVYNPLSTDPSVNNRVFSNPIKQEGFHADPFVTRACDGNYYHIEGDNGRVIIRKSSDLSQILSPSQVTSVFLQNAYNIWAPELHYLNGKWYIYYCAGENNVDSARRMYVAEGGTDPNDPLSGAFSNTSPAVPLTTIKLITSLGDNTWAIDESPFVGADGQLYLLWSGTNGGTYQNLFIQKMLNPKTLTGNAVQIASPTYQWEKYGNGVVEAPQPIMTSDGKLRIIYSASGADRAQYALGILTCESTNYLSASSYVKQASPVFASAGNIYGPGHCSFVRTGQGQWWLVYHAKVDANNNYNRKIHMQPFSWIGNIPYFGTPIQAGVNLQSPSTPVRQIADGAYSLRQMNSANQVLDVINGNVSAPGAKVQQYTWLNNSNQWFQIEYAYDEYYKIKSVYTYNGQRLVLDNAGASLNGGSSIIQWLDNGHDAQLWRFDNIGNGSYRIVNKRSLLAIDIPNGNSTPGTPVQQWFLNNAPAMLWKFEK